jgi:hypothetical protein
VANSHAELNAQIARLRELPGLVGRIAPDVAEALEDELVAQAGRQEGPDGKPWPKTESGKPALEHMRAHLRVRAVGTTVVARLEGHYALHDLGAGRGGVRRRTLPSSGIPDPVARAIDRIATAEFAATMGAP